MVVSQQGMWWQWWVAMAFAFYASLAQALPLTSADLDKLNGFFKPAFKVVVVENTRPDLLGSALVSKSCFIFSNDSHYMRKRYANLFTDEMIPVYYAHEMAHCELSYLKDLTLKQTELYSDLRAMEFMHQQGKEFFESRIGTLLELRYLGEQFKDTTRSSVCELLALNGFAARHAFQASVLDRLDWVETALKECPVGTVLDPKTLAPIVDAVLTPITPLDADVHLESSGFD